MPSYSLKVIFHFENYTGIKIGQSKFWQKKDLLLNLIKPHLQTVINPV